MHILSFLSSHHKVFYCIGQFLIVLCIAGCARQEPEFYQKTIKGFIGAPDESTRDVGEDILEHGGNAADAMAAMLLNEVVVSPAQMSLSAGGVCQVLNNPNKAKTLDFSATLQFPRAVFSLQNKYGVSRWSTVVAPALKNANKGLTISDTLAEKAASAPKLDTSWRTIKSGKKHLQPNLSQTLKMLSESGAGAFYKGEWASQLATDIGMDAATLAATKPEWKNSTVVQTGYGKTYFPQAQAMSNKGADIWRNQSEMEEINNGTTFEGVGLVAVDKNGLTVACTVGTGGLFGSGRLLKEQGFFVSRKMTPQTSLHTLNVIHVNPDETDVIAVMTGANDNALTDGLALLQETIMARNDLETAARKVGITSASHMPVLVCRKGYPSQIDSCQTNDLIDEVDD